VKKHETPCSHDVQGACRKYAQYPRLSTLTDCTQPYVNLPIVFPRPSRNLENMLLE